jgi:predicted alpha/beta superfamily hydrolase
MNKRKVIISFIAIIVILLSAQLAPAQEKAQEQETCFFTGKSVVFKSEILQEDRTINIWLPADYEDSSKSYPVLYMLDADPLFFSKVALTVEELGGEYMPDMMVVGIANVDRNRDMFPNADGSKSGADNFLSFITDELQPYINKNYSTADFEILAGQSGSGLFVTYAILSNPSSFNSYFAFSPALGYEEELILKMAQDTFSNFPINYRYLYINYGEHDSDYSLITVPKFMEIVNDKSPKALTTKVDIVPGQGHIPFTSYYDALRAQFHDYKLTEDILSEGIEAAFSHYSNLSARLGFEIAVPVNALLRIGTLHHENKEYDKAIVAFAKILERNPDHRLANLRMATTYRAMGDLENALKFYKISLKYYSDLPWLETRIKEMEAEIAK